jgi:hypothetical protein
MGTSACSVYSGETVTVPAAPQVVETAAEACADYRALMVGELTRCSGPQDPDPSLLSIEGPPCDSVSKWYDQFVECHDVLHAMACAELSRTNLSCADCGQKPIECWFGWKE